MLIMSGGFTIPGFMIFLFCFSFFEWARMRLIFFGNIRESFPEMITFPLISLLSIGAAVTTIIENAFPMTWI